LTRGYSQWTWLPAKVVNGVIIEEC
jgi:hypothetical protein